MGYWLEIHCDILAPEDGVWRGHPACYTNNANNPGRGANNGNVQKALKDLRSQAKKQGWRMTKRGWECPYCQTKAKG